MKSPTILIVDDDESILKIMRKYFERLNYKVHTSRDGESAYKYFVDNDVGLVISDLKMPKMNGDTLFAEIRDRDPNVPFFLFTGYLEHTSIPILEELGITGIVEKPLDLESLYQAIEEFLPKLPKKEKKTPISKQQFQ